MIPWGRTRTAAMMAFGSEDFDEGEEVDASPGVDLEREDDPYGEVEDHPGLGGDESVLLRDAGLPDEEEREEHKRKEEGDKEASLLPAVRGTKGQVENEEDDGHKHDERADKIEALELCLGVGVGVATGPAGHNVEGGCGDGDDEGTWP